MDKTIMVQVHKGGKYYKEDFMKKILFSGLLVFSLAMTVIGCDNGSGGGGGGGIDTTPVFTSVDELDAWLTNQPTNTAVTPYRMKLNTSDISSLKTTLNNATDKYVYLDLSGSTITTIPNGLFYTGQPYTPCLTLTGITIPDTVTSIGNAAFHSCKNLTSIIIPNSVTSIGEQTFQSCHGITNVTIGNGITAIGFNVFAYCQKLAQIIIPNNVTSIGDGAFFGCISLHTVTFQGTISSDNFSSKEGKAFEPTPIDNSFDGDLREKYLAPAGGIGTYTGWTSSGVVRWTKQP